MNKLTDAEWQSISHLFPVFERKAGQAGRAPSYPPRELFDTVLYIIHSGKKWNSLPCDGHRVPSTTAYRWFIRWSNNDIFAKVNQHLLQQIQEQQDVSFAEAIVDGMHVRAKKKEI